MSLQALFPTIAPSLRTTDGTSVSSAEDFQVLALALDAAGLTQTVAGLEETTIFAPTDAAFGALAGSLGFTGDTSDASAVFGSIATALGGLAPDGDPIPLLTDILQYHISPDAQTADALNTGGAVPTLLEDTTFEVTGDTIVDNDPDATNPDIIAADVAAGSNSVQVVDQVLLPLDTPVNDAEPTLLGVLEESGGTFDADDTDFDMLLSALQATGLDAAADDPEADLTVFVPTDGAFVDFAQAIGYDGTDEAGAFQAILDASADADPDNPLALVTDILTYHISPGTQGSEDVLDSEELETLNGETITVDGTTLVDQDATLVDPTLIATDIEASNGVAHAIDALLLPADLSNDDPIAEDTADPEAGQDDDDDGFGLLGEVLLGLGLMGALFFALAGPL